MGLSDVDSVVEQLEEGACRRPMLDPDRSVRLEELPGWTWGPRAGRSKAKTATPEAT